MSDFLREVFADTEVARAAVAAVGVVLAALIAGIFGTVISKAYLSRRDQQDREAQWRSHAIDLTKLDLERKLRTRPGGDTSPLRPSILDFLANYRDLQELGTVTPGELYERILKSRISHVRSQAGEADDHRDPH
jgi:hypothetical protein